MRAVVLTALLACALSALPSRATAGEMPQMLALYSCSPPPEKFDGKLVRIIGFLCLAFEGDAIYLRREDFDHSLTQNALWVDVPEKRDETLSRKYVLLEGTFDASDHGHMGLFGGAIRKITRMSAWHDGKL